MLIVFKETTMQVTQPVLEASLEEKSPGKPSSISESIILPTANRNVDGAVDVSSKKTAMQGASTALQTSWVEEAAGETSSAEEAMILPIENTIAEEDINVSSEKPKNKSHY
jgi:hypothetical protein